MGLEIVVLLVDVPSLRQLVTTPWCDLYSGLEKRTMRSIRPEQDSRLKVNFDIDAEAELLDWMDTQQRDSSETTSFWSCLQDSGDGEKGLLLAMAMGKGDRACWKIFRYGECQNGHEWCRARSKVECSRDVGVAWQSNTHSNIRSKSIEWFDEDWRWKFPRPGDVLVLGKHGKEGMGRKSLHVPRRCSLKND